jgi:hypothetical protein
MSLCILAGGKLTTLAIAAFTLSWTHSVERIRWEEDWRVTPAGLVVTAARVQGSGAGMDPPADSRFDGVWWHYNPALRTQAELVLADSGTAGAWRLCGADACRYLGGAGGDPIVLKACP